jgi:hypothetical protein
LQLPHPARDLWWDFRDRMVFCVFSFMERVFIERCRTRVPFCRFWIRGWA